MDGSCFLVSQPGLVLLLPVRCVCTRTWQLRSIKELHTDSSSSSDRSIYENDDDELYQQPPPLHLRRQTCGSAAVVVVKAVNVVVVVEGHEKDGNGVCVSFYERTE